MAAIQMGNEYYSDRVDINGQYYYGYYIPLRNGNEICGMVFAGMTNESVKGSVNTIVTKIVIVFLIALMAVLVIASMYAGNCRRLVYLKSYPVSKPVGKVVLVSPGVKSASRHVVKKLSRNVGTDCL